MRSIAELRAEAQRLRDAAAAASNPELKQELAARALELAVEAEAIERSAEAPAILRANIERFRSMLAIGIDDPQQKRIVEDMLRDAEELLGRLTAKS